MVEETIQFTNIYHSTLRNYLNNLIVLLKCDSKFGDYRDEFNLKIPTNFKLLKLLLECEPGKDEECFEYCQNFFFGNFNSVFDVDFQMIKDIVKFVHNKMNLFKLKFEQMLSLIVIEDTNINITLENKETTIMNLDQYKRHFGEEDLEDLHNPYKEGPDFKLELDSALE